MPEMMDKVRRARTLVDTGHLHRRRPGRRRDQRRHHRAGGRGRRRLLRRRIGRVLRAGPGRGGRRPAAHRGRAPARGLTCRLTARPSSACPAGTSPGIADGCETGRVAGPRMGEDGACAARRTCTAVHGRPRRNQHVHRHRRGTRRGRRPAGRRRGRRVRPAHRPRPAGHPGRRSRRLDLGLRGLPDRRRPVRRHLHRRRDGRDPASDRPSATLSRRRRGQPGAIRHRPRPGWAGTSCRATSTAPASSPSAPRIPAYDEIRIAVGPDLARYLAGKGAIAVDGISLTVIDVVDNDDGAEFGIGVIPGDAGPPRPSARSRSARRVNLEVDVVAKYVERLLAARDREYARMTSTSGARGSGGRQRRHAGRRPDDRGLRPRRHPGRPRRVRASDAAPAGTRPGEDAERASTRSSSRSPRSPPAGPSSSSTTRTGRTRAT